MALSEDEITLLEHHEGDLYGLWEVDWLFDGIRSDWSRETRIASLSALVERGLIDIFFGPLMTMRPPLAPDEALPRLADPTIWAPPAERDGKGYYVTTSPAGIVALQKMHSSSAM